MKALELAGKLDVARMEYWGINAPIAKPVLENAAAELRRLAEVNADLLKAINKPPNTPNTKKPGEFSVSGYALVGLYVAVNRAKEQQ